MNSYKLRNLSLTLICVVIALGLVNITLAQARSWQKAFSEDLPLENSRTAESPSAILTVGTSPGCSQYPTVQAAVDAAVDGDSIWVQAMTFTGISATVDMPDKNLTVIGGYDSFCSTVISRTVLEATGTGDSVVEFQTGSGKTISLSNFNLTGGESDPDFGGGLEISQDHNITLKSVNIYSNTSAFGGGVYIVAGTLNIEGGTNGGSNLTNNRAAQDGGGVFCSNAIVNLSQGSFIGAPNNGNFADSDGDTNGDGGGLYLDHCTLTMDGSTDSAGVRNNRAFYGGGIYAYNDSLVTITGQGAAVEYNKAVGVLASGGGLAVLTGTQVTIENASVAYNEAGFLGGGLLIQGGFDPLGDVYTPTVIISNNASIHNNLAGFGGGMYLLRQGATVLIDASIVTSNTATERGGGIRMADNVTLLTLQNGTIVSNNQAFNQYGGGIALLYDGRITLQDVTIEGNSTGGLGGGIYLEGGTPTLTAQNIVLRDNSAAGDGGGLYASNSVITMAGDGSSSLIELNEAPTGNGGGIFLSTSVMTLTNMLVHDNTAGRNGGGLVAISNSVVLINNDYPLPEEDELTSPSGRPVHPVSLVCNPDNLPADTYCSEFRDNLAGAAFTAYGGAVYLDEGSSFTAESAAFIGNSAFSGGGFVSFSGGNTIQLTNALISGNTGSPIVRLFDSGTLLFDSSTIAGNPATAISFDNPNATAQLDNNIIWDNTAGVDLNGVTPLGACNDSQGNTLPGFSQDPQFFTTTRGDYRLGPGSIAIDACSAGPAVDLDHAPRPQGAQWDIGAFEFFNPVPVAIDDVYSLYKNDTLAIPAPGVLGNDYDPYGSPLTAELETGPTHGLLSLFSDGSFMYTPSLDYTGLDSFIYITSNGVYTDTASVTLEVLPDRLVFLPLVIHTIN